MTEEQILFIRRNFADMRNQDIADALGVSKSAVSRIQKEFHLRKSPEQRRRMLAKAWLASVLTMGNKPLNITPEVIEKRVAHYKKTFREEQIRVKWGLEQLTKMRVRQEPRAKRHQRSYLKSLGYILDEPNCVAYYTPETTRAEKMERGWSKRIHNYYTFKPIEDEREYQPQRGDQPVPGE